jgi:hypothetical protein
MASASNRFRGSANSLHRLEGRSRRFRKDGIAPDGSLLSIPEGAVRLYLLTPQGQNAGLTSFLAALGESFALSPRPSFLPGPVSAMLSAAGTPQKTRRSCRAARELSATMSTPVPWGTIQPLEKQSGQAGDARASLSALPIRLTRKGSAHLRAWVEARDGRQFLL